MVLNSPEPGLASEGDRLGDVQATYAALASGKLDRSSLTPNLNYYFNPTTLGDYSSSLARLGTPKIEIRRAPRLRGGFVNRNYTLHYAGGKDLTLVTYAEPGANGRWEQFMIMPE
jgi:hypothetical protein